MIDAKTVILRSAIGVLAAGAACAALTWPSVSADPVEPAEPTTTISSVTASLSTYFAAHPDDLRAIQQPLAAFKDRCGLQVSHTDAITVLADV
jgi:hypothetical protein